MLFKQTLTRLDNILKEIWDSKKEEQCLSKQPFALAFSHQIEDVVAIDFLLQTQFFKENSSLFEFFTLDTKKLFPESLKYQEIIESYFNITIKSYCATQKELKRAEEEIGEWGMRESLEKRKECCQIRKIIPLKNALCQKFLWISGIRAAQSITRSDTKLLENDTNFNLYKINPLFDWSDSALWEYANLKNLPQNALYQLGFLSIGCSPCTRAVREGEDIRAGRWWWENPNHKECGLHIKH